MSKHARRRASSSRTFRRGAAVVVLVGELSAAGTAYAYWQAGGSGSGTAAAGVVQPLTTSPVAVTTGLLYPGTTGDVRIRVVNPNPFAVTVTSVVGTDTITSSKGAACDAATGVSFTDVTGASLAVPASSATTFTLPGAVAMDVSSDDSCQGATFTIGVTLSAVSG